MNLNLFKSRKFWATLSALAFIVFGPRAGLDQEAITQAVIVLVTFIGGVALEDGLKSLKKS